MGEALLERTLRVRAVHHYARPGWSAERNRAAFGAVAEALARWLWERLEGRVPGPARLVRVRIAESAELAAEYPAPAPFPA